MRLLGLSALMAQGLSAGGAAAWEVETRVDPMDDSTIVMVSTLSQDAVTCGDQQPVRLVLLCDSAGTQLRFEHGCFIPGDYGHVDMDWRLGEGPIGGVRFYVTGSPSWFGYPEDGQYTAKMLSEVDRLALRFTPPGQDEQTASFDLSGMAGAIAPVRDTCGW